MKHQKNRNKMISLVNMDSFCTKNLGKLSESLLQILHLSVSILIVVSIVCSALFVIITDINFYDYPFFVHCSKYIPFFFSYWVSAFQVIYFNIYTSIDLINIFAKDSIKLCKLKSKMHAVANYLLFTLVFPLSLVVLILFWGFYHWNREYIYPKLMDEFYPPWINHVMHTYPVPLSIVYMITTNNSAPKKKHTFAGLTAFLAIYSACIISIKLKTGLWVYPLLNYLKPKQVNYVFSFIVVASFMFLFLGHAMNTQIKRIRMSLKNVKPKKLKQ